MLEKKVGYRKNNVGCVITIIIFLTVVVKLYCFENFA